MPKFIIEYDSSRINNNNEPFPLGQYVNGVLSLKNTNNFYTLYIGETNKDSLTDDVSTFKSNIEIYKKLVVSLPLEKKSINIGRLPNIKNIYNFPLPKLNNITGQKQPYVFVGKINELIPHPNKQLASELRKKAIKDIPNIPKNLNIKLDTLLKTNLNNLEKNNLDNKLTNLVNSPQVKLSSLPVTQILKNIKRK